MFLLACQQQLCDQFNLLTCNTMHECDRPSAVPPQTLFFYYYPSVCQDLNLESSCSKLNWLEMSQHAFVPVTQELVMIIKASRSRSCCQSLHSFSCCTNVQTGVKYSAAAARWRCWNMKHKTGRWSETMQDTELFFFWQTSPYIFCFTSSHLSSSAGINESQTTVWMLKLRL